MKLERKWDWKRECMDCDAYEYLYEITLREDCDYIRLCPKCLVKLLKAIMERED